MVKRWVEVTLDVDVVEKGSHSKGSPISRHGMPELVLPPLQKSIIPLPVGLHDSGEA